MTMMPPEQIIAFKRACEETELMISDMAKVCLEISNEGNDFYYRFSDENIMDALIIFNTMVQNFIIHKGMDKKKTNGEMTEIVVDYAERMRKLILDYCGFDTKQFYNKK